MFRNFQIFRRNNCQHIILYNTFRAKAKPSLQFYSRRRRRRVIASSRCGVVASSKRRIVASESTCNCKTQSKSEMLIEPSISKPIASCQTKCLAKRFLKIQGTQMLEANKISNPSRKEIMNADLAFNVKATCTLPNEIFCILFFESTGKPNVRGQSKFAHTLRAPKVMAHAPSPAAHQAVIQRLHKPERIPCLQVLFFSF